MKDRLPPADEIVLIYSDFNDMNKFDAGKIVRIFEKEVLLAHYLPNGNYDGFKVIAIENIVKIEMNSLYSNKIKLLAQYHNTKHETINRFEKNGFLTLLRYAKEFGKVVSVEMMDSGRNDIIGFVTRFDEKNCLFDQVDDYGNVDGQAIIDVSDISYLACDGDDENTIQIMNKLKKQEGKN